jgi:hypothetical protein
MKKNLQLLLLSGCLLSGILHNVKAQGTDGYGAGIKVALDTTGKKYIRILNWHQVWVRHNENNPGSTVNGTPEESQWDMGLRRSRFLLHTQINPNFMLVTHFGINNANQISGGANGQGASGADGKKPQLFMHDAYVEHRVYKDMLWLGAGLQYNIGPSRLSSASTLNFLGLDSPIFSWQNIEATDQFARQYGIFAKGQILKDKRLDYRVSLNFPFAIAKGAALSALDTVAANNGRTSTSYHAGGQPHVAYTGYFKYQFWDIESNVLPFQVGTYIGTKKVFNIGAGFYQHKDAMWSAMANTADTVMASQLFLSADAFLDVPIGKKYALTAYTSYTYADMGENYIRNIGLMNPANGVISAQATFNGSGNAVPTIGTGSVFFAQAGLALPKIKKIGRFQPYASLLMANYERIADKVLIPDVGFNWFLAGHSAKITVNYRPRPVFTYDTPGQKWSDIHMTDRKNELTIQFQVYL